MKQETEKLDFCRNVHPERGCTIELGRQILTVPAWANARLRRIGGVSPNGLPMFRLVWGRSRMGYIGGFVWDVLRDSNDEPILNWHGKPFDVIIIQPTTVVPKYWPNLDHFYLEMWRPPEFYGTPETWKQFTEMVPEHLGAAVRGPDLPAGSVIEALGPYPDRGDYEPVMMFENVPGESLPDRSIYDAMLLATQAQTLSDKFRYAARQRNIMEEAKRERWKWRADQRARLDLVWDKLPKRHVGPGRSPQVGYTGPGQYGHFSYNPSRKETVN